MGNVLVQLVPLVIGSMAIPTWALVVLALLSQGRGPLAATAFAAGITSVRLLQGIVFGTILSAYELSHHLSRPDAALSILLIVLGVLMWALAVGQVLQKNDLKLMSMVGALTPVRALGLGALLVVTSSRAWIFTLGALGIIEKAELDIVQTIIAYLLYVVAAEALLIAPILVSVRWSIRFEAAAQWLERYNRPIVVIASFAVGCFFLWQGITGLMGAWS